jgi:hypothetical protein
MIRTTIIIATALACVAVLPAAPALAQRARVFVASYGSDSNPCTFGSPCKTFQQAVGVVADGGEVTAIDSAGFGPVIISQSVTITSPPGVEAGIVAASGAPAITINSGDGAAIQLRGLTLDGVAGGTNGIFFGGGSARVEIIDCLIHHFSNDGILLAPNSGANMPDTVVISNTVASDNGAFGIEIDPQSGFIQRGAIDHVSTGGNGLSGISLNGTNTSQFVDFAISNSVSDGNNGNGILVQGNGNVKAEIRDSTLSNNLNTGLTTSNARVGIYANSIVLNQIGFSIANSGFIFSFGNNDIENNAGANTGTLTPATPQ